MNKNEIIEKLKSIKTKLSNDFSVNEIALFGSYARDEATVHSDIDLMLDFNKKTYNNFIHAIYFIEENFKGYKIQIVSKKGIKPHYFQSIQQDLIYA